MVLGTHKIRGREIVLWLVILAAVFNFAPGLFTTESTEQEPTWRKALKDIPVAALMAVAVSVALRGRDRGRARPSPRDLPARARELAGRSAFPEAMWAALVLLTGYMVVDTALRAPPPLELLVSLRYYVLYPLVAWAVWRLRLTRSELARVVLGLAALGALQGFLSVLEFTRVIPDTFYANYVNFGGGNHSRAIGTLGNPNNLALFLALPAILLLAGACGTGLRRWATLGCVFVGMALTFSKAVGLALIVAVVVLERSRSGATRNRVLRIVGLVAASAALTLFSLSGRVGDLYSITERSTAAEIAWRRWTSDTWTFLTGEGFGSIVEAGNNQVRGLVTDNMILTLGVEGGLLAIVLFGIVVLAAFTGAARARRRSPDPLPVALHAYLVFFLLYSPFATNFRLFPGALFYWLAVGLALAAAPSRASRTISS